MPVKVKPLPSHPRAVLLDALGTLLRLEDPVPALRGELRDRFGVEVPAEAARHALAQEIAFYRANLLDGYDRASLAALRRRCTHVLLRALGDAGGDIPERDAVPALMASLRFSAYPDAAPALDRLRRRGFRLVVVSNWDISVHDRLAEVGLSEHLTGAIASAQLGVSKPAPAVFGHALTLAGVEAHHAVHVGDSLREDVAGAGDAGIRPILIDRSKELRAPRDVTVIPSLRELPRILA